MAKHRIAFWMRQRIALEREGLEPLQTNAPGKPVFPIESRQLVWLLLKEPDVLEVHELTHVNLIVQASQSLAAVREFVLEFQRCVRARDVMKLEAWFERVAVSEVQDFKSFAKGFDRDKAALFEALELSWSKRERPARCRLVSKNGPVEGRVNKLKLIKRQGFGRSGFALLKKRVPHAG